MKKSLSILLKQKFVISIVMISILQFSNINTSYADNVTNKAKPPIRIGIVEPLQHKAMDEIVSGFKQSLMANYKGVVTIKIENAQGDMNLQRAIIQKMQNANYDMVVPIGVAATQMTLSMIKNKPVVSLASDFSTEDRNKLKNCNIVAIHDEISAMQTLTFIRQVYPKITNILLVHSSADKVLPEVQKTKNIGKQLGITITNAMINNLSELNNTTRQAIRSNTQLILVLKDSLIVSGTPTLVKIAIDKKLPLVTSDQGSVQDGATVALGVHENQIGIEGGNLAASILNGKNICQIPMVDMTKLTIFINKSTLDRSGQNLTSISDTAKKLGYPIEYVK